MGLSNLMYERDFYKLNNDDISALIKALKLNLEKSDEGKRHIFQNRDNYFNMSYEAKEIILNKVFVGRTSVKWYKIHELDAERQKEIILNIEQLPYYNKSIHVNPIDVKITTCIGCFKLCNNKYIFRYLVPDRKVRQDDGLNISRVKKTKNVITIIDLENRFIEIRTEARIAKKILDAIISETGLIEIGEHVVLYRYQDCIETFRDSLLEGRFKNFKAAPKNHIDLNDEDTVVLINILKIIDKFFEDRESDKLVKSLEKIDFETDGLNFTEIFLGGMAKIGMSIRKDYSKDLSSQPIYRMLDDYINNESCYISFENPEDNNLYTIKIGLTTNSIVFVSEGSESAIVYIRDKLL